MARKSRKIINTNDQLESIHIYKVAIYVRLSVEDMRKKISDSIGTQKSMLIRYLQTQNDMEIYDVYEDINYTGTNFDRPRFIKMIEDIQQGLVDCVIVKDLSRFGRNFGETSQFLERIFPIQGVRFISLDDSFDSLTTSINESISLKNLVNEMYSRDISKKIKSSIKIKQKRGEFCGCIAPYGYIKKGNSLIIDEEAAPIVRLIFKWILENYSDYAIVAKLNDQKIMPPSRYRFEKGMSKTKKYGETRFWHKSTVKRIAENPAYMGVLAQGKHQSNFLKGSKYKFRNGDKLIVVEDTHEPIIDKKIFETVKRIRDSRKKDTKIYDPKGDNIFKGLIFCADCNAHMTRRKLNYIDNNDEYYFSCNTYMHINKQACSKKKIIESELKEAIFLLIKNQIMLNGGISYIMKKVQNLYNDQYNTIDKQINALEKKMQQNLHLRGSLREKYKRCIISEKKYTIMKKNYDSKKEILSTELEILLSKKFTYDTNLSKEEVEFRKFETEQSLSSKIMSAFIEKIYIYDNEKISIKFSCYDELQ